MAGSASLHTGPKSCGISADIRNTKPSRAVRFTPSASVHMGSGATLCTTTRRRRNTPSLVPPPHLPPPPQAFPSSRPSSPARTDRHLSDKASALLGFPRPLSSLLLLLFLPLLLSHELHRPPLLLAPTLPTSFLMPSWRWTLPSRRPLPSTSPPSARPPQPIPALHSCLPQTPAAPRVGVLQLPPLP